MIYDVKNQSKDLQEKNSCYCESKEAKLTELIGGIVGKNNVLRKKAKEKLEELSRIGFNENGVYNAAYSSSLYIRNLNREVALDEADDLLDDINSKNLEVILQKEN